MSVSTLGVAVQIGEKNCLCALIVNFAQKWQRKANLHTLTGADGIGIQHQREGEFDTFCLRTRIAVASYILQKNNLSHHVCMTIVFGASIVLRSTASTLEPNMIKRLQQPRTKRHRLGLMMCISRAFSARRPIYLLESRSSRRSLLRS